ncbi:MAG: MBL fold metallo-hydrolase [Thermodesulfobacteriota bacterium]
MIKKFVVGPLDVNCYLIADKDAGECAIIDPGGNPKELKEAIDSTGGALKYIINTHGHFDHVGGNAGVKKLFPDAAIMVHKEDALLLRQTKEYASNFGLTAEASPAPDSLLEEGTPVLIGSKKLEVLHTPGHTLGGVCLYLADDGVLFTGDTLFAGSIGRTDLPGGSFETLMQSIKEKILTLPGSTLVYPGHGDASSIGNEKRANQYVNELL